MSAFFFETSRDSLDARKKSHDLLREACEREPLACASYAKHIIRYDTASHDVLNAAIKRACDADAKHCSLLHDAARLARASTKSLSEETLQFYQRRVCDGSPEDCVQYSHKTGALHRQRPRDSLIKRCHSGQLQDCRDLLLRYEQRRAQRNKPERTRYSRMACYQGEPRRCLPLFNLGAQQARADCIETRSLDGCRALFHAYKKRHRVEDTSPLTPKQLERIVSDLQVACDVGVSEACATLARRRIKPRIRSWLPKHAPDAAIAGRFFERACTLGDKNACGDFNDLASKIPDLVSEARKKNVLTASCERGDAGACVQLVANGHPEGITPCHPQHLRLETCQRVADRSILALKKNTAPIPSHLSTLEAACNVYFSRPCWSLATYHAKKTDADTALHFLKKTCHNPSTPSKCSDAITSLISGSRGFAVNVELAHQILRRRCYEGHIVNDCHTLSHRLLSSEPYQDTKKGEDVLAFSCARRDRNSCTRYWERLLKVGNTAAAQRIMRLECVEHNETQACGSLSRQVGAQALVDECKGGDEKLCTALRSFFLQQVKSKTIKQVKSPLFDFFQTQCDQNSGEDCMYLAHAILWERSPDALPRARSLYEKSCILQSNAASKKPKTCAGLHSLCKTPHRDVTSCLILTQWHESGFIVQKSSRAAEKYRQRACKWGWTDPQCSP